MRPTTNPRCECSQWTATINGKLTSTGCTSTTKGGKFTPGHDAKLKSLFRRATTVTRTGEDTTTPQKAINHHFPQWAPGAAKLPRRSRTRKIPTPPTPIAACDCGKPATHGSRCRVCALMASMEQLTTRRTRCQPANPQEIPLLSTGNSQPNT